MHKSELYNNIVQSIVKFSVDFLQAEGLMLDCYVDWDAHAQLAELPAKPTIIGPAGVGMTDENSGIEVIFSIGAATESDTNLFRLRGIMSRLYGSLAPETRVTIYDHATGTPVSWMVTATPVAITPVSKAETRSLQFIQVRALIDPAAASSLLSA